jgi:pilus assembly protein CpaB
VNPRQRRGALLVALAAVGAIGVFFSISTYVSQIQSQVGPLVRVLELREDLAPYTPLTEERLAQVEIPERWAPPGAVRDPGAVVGLVADTALPSGTLLQEGMLAPPPELQPGQRELAILVDAETGVAGKIGPGSTVDIYATFPGTDEAPPWSSNVVDQARIIDVGLPARGEEANPDGSFEESELVPVTFALSVPDSLRVAYVESFADNVRLALRAPTDTAPVDEEQRRYQPFPPQPGEVP